MTERRELPVERKFNGIKGAEGLSATALYNFLKNRCGPRDDNSFGDPNYYASAPMWVSLDLGDGKFYQIDITDAGFSCMSPELILHGKPHVNTWTIEGSKIVTEGVHSFTLSGDSFTDYQWGTIISDTPVDKVGTRTNYAKYVSKEDSPDGKSRSYRGINFRSIEYMEKHEPGIPTLIHTRWLYDEKIVEDEPYQIDFKPVESDGE